MSNRKLSATEISERMLARTFTERKRAFTLADSIESSLGFKFKPHKVSAGSEVTNDQRAIRADCAVRLHPDFHSKEQFDNAVNIIADILHYCDREKVNPYYVLSLAQQHWEAER